MSATIYVADDDHHICELLIDHLSQHGYTVKGFSNGDTLVKAFQVAPCDLIITDIMMPVMGGYDVCKSIRQQSDVPIIMISANNDEIDRVLGLELGSDDYIGKPISFRELNLKVKNLLKRYKPSTGETKPQAAASPHVLSHLDVTLDMHAHTVQVEGKPLHVTPTEFEILALFLSAVNRVFTREQMLSNVWEDDFGGDMRQVDHAIKRLRKKMLQAQAQCRIQTVWGVGYKMV